MKKPKSVRREAVKKRGKGGGKQAQTSSKHVRTCCAQEKVGVGGQCYENVALARVGGRVTKKQPGKDEKGQKI